MRPLPLKSPIGSRDRNWIAPPEWQSPEDYGPRFDCPICKGSGWVYADVTPNHSKYGQVIPCPGQGCLKYQFDNRHTVRAKREQRDGKPMTFETFKEYPGSKKCLAAAKEFASGKIRWLLLYGGTGNGKSSLLRAIQHAMKGKHEVYFEEVAEFFDEYRKAIRAEDGSGDAFLDHAKHCDVLILDDWGKERGTDFEVSELEKILSSRYNRGALTAMATNKDIVDLPERLQSRFRDVNMSRAVLNKDIDRRIAKEG